VICSIYPGALERVLCFAVNNLKQQSGYVYKQETGIEMMHPTWLELTKETEDDLQLGETNLQMGLYRQGSATTSHWHSPVGESCTTMCIHIDRFGDRFWEDLQYFIRKIQFDSKL